jgi:RNA polymerase sigma factor (sigma-70 family)
MRRTRDRGLAEDLAQETFLRATRAFLGWRGGRPEAWLLAIAGHVLIDYFRKHGDPKHREPLPLLDELLPVVEPPSADARSDVEETLSRLPRDQARLLELLHVYGFTHAEIAAMHGSTSGAVKTASWRARDAFRRLYEEGMDDHE